MLHFKNPNQQKVYFLTMSVLCHGILLSDWLAASLSEWLWLSDWLAASLSEWLWLSDWLAASMSEWLWLPASQLVKEISESLA